MRAEWIYADNQTGPLILQQKKTVQDTVKLREKP